jgi:hypothetical protein
VTAHPADWSREAALLGGVEHLLHPRTGEPIRPLGFTKRGAPIWPILGGSEPQGEPEKKPDAPKPGSPAPKAQEPAGDPEKPAEGPHGYPEGTPVAEMTDRQAAAYWRHQSRRHEDARKSAQSELAAVKPKADQYDALAEASKSEQERAVESAKTEAANTAKAEAAVALAGQRLQGLLMARGKSEDEADAIVDDVNVAKYVKDGQVDKDALRSAADRLAPKVETPPAKPADLGQGNRGDAGKTGVDAGRSLYADRHPKRARDGAGK